MSVTKLNRDIIFTMKHTLKLLAIFLLLNVSCECDAELNVTPRDTEVKINDSTYMNCSTSLRADLVQWRHGSNYVYTSVAILEPYNERFSIEINASTGACNLVIRSVQPSDAGKYVCVEDEGFGERKSAQLIVLNADPVCKSNIPSEGVIGPNSCDIKPDEIQISCGTSYHGNIPSVLRWKSNGDDESITDGLLNVTFNQNEVLYTLKIKSTLDLNNAWFICETTRSAKRNYSCSSDAIKISHVFSSKVTINMTMDDEVSCSANTSQSCSYKWKWLSGDYSTTESDNQILKPKKVGWHRCEATCSFGNRPCTVGVMHAEVYPYEVVSEQKFLALLVLVALTTSIPICVVILYCRKKKNKEIPIGSCSRPTPHDGSKC